MVLCVGWHQQKMAVHTFQISIVSQARPNPETVKY